MPGWPTPADEAVRLASLRSLRILDTEDEERFDRITRITKRLLGTPIVLMSLVDEERQWFKSRQGLEVRETSREVSFCAHAVAADDVLVVPDAQQDPRFRDNPLVTGAPHIRFYAGVPVHAGGHPVGTLCAIDSSPRTITAADLQTLADLAETVEIELARGHSAMIDPLTGLLNRRGLEEVARVVIPLAQRHQNQVAVLFADLDGLKAINDTWGHPAGDAAIRHAAKILSETFRQSDGVARVSGDEMCVLMVAGQQGFDRAERSPGLRISAALEQEPSPEGFDQVRITMSTGIAVAEADRDETLADLLARADREMYKAKNRARRDPVATAQRTSSTDAAGHLFERP